MSSEAVLEIVHLRLHAAGSSFPLARLPTPDLPSSFLDIWRQICSSAANAGGHCFRLFRSINDPADFYFVGGWDDPAVHAKLIARSRDSLLAARLGKWMEHLSVRHIKGDVDVLDKFEDSVKLKAAIREWDVTVDGENPFEGSKFWTKGTCLCAAGWDVSEEVQSEYEEFENMAKVLDNGEKAFKLGRGRVEKDVKAWVAVRFAREHSWLKPELSDEGRSLVLSFVLGASPGHFNESQSSLTDGK